MPREIVMSDLARAYHEVLRLVVQADGRRIESNGPFGYVIVPWGDLDAEDQQQVYGVVKTFLAGGQWHQCYYILGQDDRKWGCPWFVSECCDVLVHVITPLAKFVRTPDCVGPVS